MAPVKQTRYHQHNHHNHMRVLVVLDVAWLIVIVCAYACGIRHETMIIRTAVNHNHDLSTTFNQ